MPVVDVYYYTDPACPWSWALEPALRRLQHECAESLRISYVMCGMARVFEDPGSVAVESLHASDRSGMPVDGRLWLEDAPRSSHPACLAVKAAAEQGDPAPYLRRLREGLLCRRRRFDGTEALVEEARMVPELDAARFRIDLGSHAMLEGFAADLDRAAAVPEQHRAPDSARPQLPSLEFRGEDGVTHGVYGFSDYERLLDAARAAGAATGSSTPSIEEALRRFPTMATVEVAALCDLPGPNAPAELWRLAVGWRVKPERVGNGELWSLA
ncbi:MAG: DsbA family protein [Solirubrobacterales bacterium]|nr:DsbA family protein [Solirubrobacterales bacterium]MBV9472149.1 DsbA family protein [Solirubrobacterales bacterium]